MSSSDFVRGQNQKPEAKRLLAILLYRRINSGGNPTRTDEGGSRRGGKDWRPQGSVSWPAEARLWTRDESKERQEQLQISMEAADIEDAAGSVVAALTNVNTSTDAQAGEHVKVVARESEACDNDNGNDGSDNGDNDDGSDYNDDEDDDDDDSFFYEGMPKRRAPAQMVVVQPATYDIDLGRTAAFLVRCGINLVLPFVNGMMMGFGEIFAHELCFRWQWQFARVQPAHRMATRPVGIGASRQISSVLG